MSKLSGARIKVPSVPGPGAGRGTHCTLNYLTPNAQVKCMARHLGSPSLSGSEGKCRTPGQRTERRDRAGKATQATKLPEKTKKEPLAKLDGARVQIMSKMKVVANMVDERLDGAIESAKIEVNSYITQALQSAGAHPLAQGSAAYSPMQLPEIAP